MRHQYTTEVCRKQEHIGVERFLRRQYVGMGFATSKSWNNCESEIRIRRQASPSALTARS